MVYEVRFTKEAKKDIAKLTTKSKQKLIYIHRAKTHYGE